MSRSIRTAACCAALLTAGVFALACGGSDDPGAPVTGGSAADAAAKVNEMKDAAAAEASAMKDAAAAEASAMKDAAAAKASAMKDSATAAVADVASPGTAASAVQTCIQLAAKRDWNSALEPCTRAAEEKPGDLQIRHALQQAQAAAAETP